MNLASTHLLVSLKRARKLHKPGQLYDAAMWLFIRAYSHEYARLPTCFNFTSMRSMTFDADTVDQTKSIDELSLHPRASVMKDPCKPSDVVQYIKNAEKKEKEKADLLKKQAEAQKKKADTQKKDAKEMEAQKKENEAEKNVVPPDEPEAKPPIDAQGKIARLDLRGLNLEKQKLNGLDLSNADCRNAIFR